MTIISSEDLFERLGVVTVDMTMTSIEFMIIDARYRYWEISVGYAQHNSAFCAQRQRKSESDRILS